MTKNTIVGTRVLYRTTSCRGDGKPILATKDDIRQAAELGALCLRDEIRLAVDVELSNGTYKRVYVNMTEVGA